MKPLACLAVAAAVGAVHAAESVVPIGCPDAPASWVDERGDLHESWGSIGLRLEQPAGGSEPTQRYRVDPAPRVVTTRGTGSVILTTEAYRAPVFPRGVDVLTATLRNRTDGEVAVRLLVQLPDGADIGERNVTVNRRVALALPREPLPLRTERPWGCAGGVVAMPGWARPNRSCDPAFANISAGMGGVSIGYRFAVPAGARRTVVLGLCESHWAEPKRRLLLLEVEGAARRDADPVAEWGRHTPGCLRFDGADANGDGRLEVSVLPHPAAGDRNTILNAIWVFEPGVQVDTDAVLRGAMSPVAERYVDVGGEHDQLLYEAEPLVYELALGPGAERELRFLVACSGSLPDPYASPWTPGSLRRAAEAVWADCLGVGARVELPGESRSQWDGAVAEILMSRAQADAYFVALPRGTGSERFSHAMAASIIAALDLAGQHAEAERMLRVYWDRPVPELFATLTQSADGMWRDPVGDPCAHGAAMAALARHALLTADVQWARRVWPTMLAGAQCLERPSTRAELPAGDAARASAVGLLGAAGVARLLGLADGERLEVRARGLDPDARWSAVPRWDDGVRTPSAADVLLQWRDAIVREGHDQLWLLPDLDGIGRGAQDLSATGLPTGFGPVSVDFAAGHGRAVIDFDLQSRRGADPLVIVQAPAMDGMKPVQARVDGRDTKLAEGHTAHIAPGVGTHEVVFLYP